ncbi:hypothetical protein GOP47_0007689 [Adiantum capillus-veneris]|uniref:Transmembrane protein 45B n=1 Tax=Adiantum capillus-veneris TaxID=13818 RepID=A0A9D4V169_ADICA|nr:hypothetical protein GOP47_0007689 [Adiantum capillus-veneris]
MGTFIGHVAPGIGFLVIGVWHLFNTLRNYVRGPWNFETRPWFPSKLCGGKLRHIELYAIMGGSLLSIASELFIGPQRHQPLAGDLSIPPEHLNNFEHSTISLFLFMYAMVARLSDTGGSHDEEDSRVARMLIPFGLVHIVGALAFAQELLLFHLHSADHMGLEGHYHWLLQLIIWVSLVCTLMEVSWPQSFLVALVRALSIVFQGVWFIQMGFVLWIPMFTPKGCALKQEELHQVVRCDSEDFTMRAKALATLQFSWYLAGVVALALLAFVLAIRCYAASFHKYESIEDAVAAQDLRKVELAIRDSYKSRSLSGSDRSMEGFPSLNLER